MRTKDFQYDSLKYWRDEDSEEATQVVKDYEKNTLKELFEFYNNVTTREGIPKDEKELRITILRLYIAKKLDLVEQDRFEYFVETASGEIYQLEKDLKQLKKRFENHRHSTDKTYGEKPVW